MASKNSRTIGGVKTLTARIPKPMHNELTKQAEALGITITAMVTRVLKNWLEKPKNRRTL